MTRSSTNDYEATSETVNSAQLGRIRETPTTTQPCAWYIDYIEVVSGLWCCTYQPQGGQWFGEEEVGYADGVSTIYYIPISSAYVPGSLRVWVDGLEQTVGGHRVQPEHRASSPSRSRPRPANSSPPPGGWPRCPASPTSTSCTGEPMGSTFNADDLGIDAIAGLAATDVQGALEEIAYGPAFSSVASLTNKSGGTVNAGDVVIIDPANADAFKTTTTAAEEQTVMVVQETILANATGIVATSGGVLIVNTNSVSTTIGHYLFTSTGAKIATASATRGPGAFGQVISGGADPEAIIWGVGDQSGTGITDIVDLPTAETDTTLVLAPDGVGGVEFRAETGGAADIIDIPTAETDTSLRLAPDGAGNVEWAATGSGNYSSSVPWSSGTSMPGSPGTNDRVTRTDLGMDFYYDGTRWLSTTLYTLSIATQIAVDPVSVSSTKRAPFPSLTLDIYVIDFWAATFVASTNDGSKYWTIALNTPSSTLSTISNTPSTLVVESASVNTLLANTNGWVQVDITKVSTPGTLHSTPVISYRLIGT